MSLQHLLTTLVVPPLSLVLLALAGGLLARWRPRAGLALVLLPLLSLLLLATPAVEGLLRYGLEREALLAPPAGTPQAIIVLGGEAVRGQEGLQPGPLTLERLRAGAALHRRTGLPLLVTSGPLAAGDPPLAEAMRRSLEEDFRVPVRWLEARAPDTRGNAELSAALLRAEGIDTAYIVTHAWHMPRAREAFARTGLIALPAAVRVEPPPRLVLSDWLPQPTRLGESWYMLREWLGRAIYAWRDG